MPSSRVLVENPRRFTLFPMSLPYSISIHTDDLYHQTIRKNGFISCIVMFKSPPFQSLRMAFCLHCRQLLSYTGCLKHKKQLESKYKIDLASLFFPEKMEEYKRQIIADVDLICDKWSSKASSISETQVHPLNDTFSSERPAFCYKSANREPT